MSGLLIMQTEAQGIFLHVKISDGQFKGISAAFYQYSQGLHGLANSGKRIGHRIRHRITTLLVDFTCVDPG